MEFFSRVRTIFQVKILASIDFLDQPELGGICFLAEGEGFEPPVGFRLRWFSRPVLSTAQPSLRVGNVAEILSEGVPDSLLPPIIQVHVAYARHPPPAFSPAIFLLSRYALPDMH